ncbi:Gfo/Idh/MocA family oxidoreductase [Devosia alba]|uniref:Gfo/Idh/MocA family oxidoreductase n=1 Tax=Devosia alba TaxID=3152360 RepID=UPI003265DEEF
MQIDLHLSADTFIHSHCRALATHPGYDLVGAVEPVEERRAAFERQYHRPSVANLADGLAQLAPELVVVSVPTQLHAGMIEQILALAVPRAIVCEKPLALDLTEAREMVERCEAAGVALYVNYIRQSQPGVKDIAAKLASGEIATPLKGVAWYSKGLFNNGSHFVTLLQHWLGPLASFQVTSAAPNWRGSDPEPDVVLRFRDGVVHLLAAREEDYSHYGIELVSPSGRLRYDDGGNSILWQPAIESPDFPGYRTLSPMPQNIAVGLNQIQWHVFDEILADLDGRSASICTGRQALTVLEQLAAIRDAL